MTTIEQRCFHCDERVTTGNQFVTLINEQQRSMCCPGCQAVSQAIMDAGLKNYYKYRTEPGAKQSAIIPEQLNAFSAYDLDEVQQDFVFNDAELSCVSLSIDGITCAACAWLIEHKLKSIEGISKIVVNSTTQRALLSWDSSQIKLSQILGLIASIGYVAAPYQADDEEAKARNSSKQFLLRLGLAGFSTMQVMMFALALYAGLFTDLSPEFRDYFRWVSMIFAAPVALYSAQPFYFSAIRALLAKNINMDVPVSIAISGAFISSCIATYHGTGEVYFESVSMFTFFLLLGRYFEQKAKQKASVNSSNLHKLVPLTAHMIVGDDISEVAAKQLKVDDLILVKPGDLVSADGQIVEGKSSINEAMLTGENIPISKSVGEQVYAGTINIDQPLTIKVTAIGNDQFVSEIIRLQEFASNNRPAISLLVDKLSRYFSAAVLSVSLITYLVWHFFISPADAFWVTLSVLVATCPCALALATPTAVTCAISTFTKLGIITRKSGVFELLPQLDTVIFDKTGTLTYGTLSITDISLFSDIEKDEVLRICASLENKSIHPIAHAFAPFFDSNIQIKALKHIVGQGVTGEYMQNQYALGNEKLTGAQAVSDLQQHIWLSKNDELIARITFNDELRDDAIQTVKQSNMLKLHTIIASGDNSGQVSHVADKVTVQEKYAGLSPNGKLELMKSFQKQGKRVAMFGDGINDAPVLAGADLSIAMGSGTAIAKNSADLILLGDKLSRFIQAITIAKKTTRIIRQNLFWALGYNAIVLPLAMTGNIAPYVAAIGMSASSLIVVTNSLRLLKDPA